MLVWRGEERRGEERRGKETRDPMIMGVYSQTRTQLEVGCVCFGIINVGMERREEERRGEERREEERKQGTP